MDSLAIIAGNGNYPFAMVRGARRAGVTRIVAAAFDGETRPELAAQVDGIEWMRVGQLGRLLKWLKSSGVRHAVMAGQIAPSNLFNLRPDLKTLILLAKLKERNAESIFGAIAAELTAIGVELILATTFMEECLAPSGHFAGPRLKPRHEDDLRFGLRIAKETSRLDIGQTVVVKNGTVLAVEAFEGTNDAIARGGKLGRGGATMVKVSKPNQDLRFDVPVIGTKTLETAREAGVSFIGIEAGRTLVLDRPEVERLAAEWKISVCGVGE